jgi:1-acyl-sn-glycerol-3-phosphate acyltransferase
MKPLQHALALASSLFVILNLGLLMFPVFFFALIKLALGRIPVINNFVNTALEFFYRTAARGNSAWMLHVVGIRVHLTGEIPDHPAPIIIVNHQTWMDIPIVHHVVTDHGPILKFLIKRQLVWVPIVGWLCYALNFPRLNRGTGKNSRGKDFAAIESASATLANERGALLIYAEGTRFTSQKHLNQKSPYRHLLTPKPGGLKIALAAVPDDTPVLDMTITYPHQNIHFWECLGGANKDIYVDIQQYKAGEIDDVRSWLADRWQEKDERIEAQLSERHG